MRLTTLRGVIDSLPEDPGAKQLPQMWAVLEHIFSGNTPGSIQQRANDLAQIKDHKKAEEIVGALLTKYLTTCVIYHGFL